MAIDLVRNSFHDVARERFTKLLERSASGYVEPLQVALGHLSFGDYSLAVESLAQGAGIGDIHMLWLHLWPFLDPLRERADFKSLVKKLGLPAAPEPAAD
jgi:hypothetical protein